MTEHPAKFSAPIVKVMQQLIAYEVDGYGGGDPRVLDPFAGVGGFREIEDTRLSFGTELEWEWASQCDKGMIVANALSLPFPDGAFDIIVTSPCYGNRMADHHDAKERCKPCSGTGMIPVSGRGGDGFDRCEKCDGMGFRKYDRITYKHKLGRKPSKDSSAVMQWGPEYRKFHFRAWWEADRVLRDGGLFLLNVGDHIRGHQRQEVSKWHYGVLRELGYEQERRIKVKTKKMKKGANRDARVPYEYVIAMRKAA